MSCPLDHSEGLEAAARPIDYVSCGSRLTFVSISVVGIPDKQFDFHMAPPSSSVAGGMDDTKEKKVRVAVFTSELMITMHKTHSGCDLGAAHTLEVGERLKVRMKPAPIQTLSSIASESLLTYVCFQSILGVGGQRLWRGI